MVSKARRKKARRRPGRFRRWFVRPAVWSLVLLGLVFLGVYLYLGSRGFSERLRRMAEQRLETMLERDVRIDSLHLDLMPLSVVVEGFEIAGSEVDGAPMASVERAQLDARVGSLLKPGLFLDELVLETPRFRLTYDEEGRNNLPRRRRRGERRDASGLPFDLEIGDLRVIDGELEIDHRKIPLELEARDLEAWFSGTGADLELRGSATAEEVSLELRGAKPYLGRVEVAGLLRRHRFDVERWRMVAPDLQARGSGFVRWLGDREVEIRADASGDLRVLERLGFLEGQVAGDFEFSGAMTRKPGVWLIEGDVTAPRARLFGRALTDLRARVEGDRNTVTIEAERSRYGGGRVGGTVRFGLALERGRVDLELDLDRVPLDTLMADQGIPISGLGGAVSGAFNYQFETRDPRGGNGWADLVISDELDPDPADLRLAGTAPLTIGSGVIRSDALRLTSGAQELSARGSYDLGTSTGRYDFELASERVAEVLALVPGSEAPGPGSAWRPREGRGTMIGTLTLERGRASLDSRLDLEEIVAPGYRADRLAGSVVLDRDGVRDLRFELARSDAALIVSGTIPFAETRSGAEAAVPLELAVDAAGWPLDEAGAWVPYEVPVTGLYTGAIEVGGDLAAPRTRVAGRLAPVGFRGLEGQALELEARVSSDRVEVLSSSLEVSEGSLSLRGELDRLTGAMSFAIDSTPLDLRHGQIAEIVGADVAGQLAVTGRLDGTLEAPDVTAGLSWSDVSIAGEPLPQDEQPALEASWRGAEVSVNGSLLGLVELAGVGVASAKGVDLRFELGNGRLDRVNRLFGGELLRDIGGEFSGELAIAGEAAGGAAVLSADDVSAALRLGRLVVERQGVRLTNLEPVVAELDARTLRIRSCYLGGEEASSELFVGGDVTLGEAATLDLNLQASLDTRWLQPLLASQWPGARMSDGLFEGIGAVVGPVAGPRFNGVGEITGGRVTADELPTSLDRVSMTLLFYPGLVVVEDANATLAGGTVRAGGSIDLSDPARSVPYRFQLLGERVSYRLPQGFLVRGDVDLSLASTPDGRQLTGIARLDRAFYLDDVKVGLEQLLATMFSRERLEAGPTDELRSTTSLDLRVEGEKSLRVRNNLADLRGDVDLILRGTLARPVIFGTVEVEPGGRLLYSGNNYQVELGTLTFNNPYRIEPVIDLLARSRLREYEITLGLSGTLDRLAIDLSSNPPLADLEVLALLTGAGEVGQRTVGAEEPQTGEGVGAERFLYGQATSLVAQRFNRLFGLDELRIDPLTSATGSLSSARVTVGKQLSRDLAATYSWDPSETVDEILELEWSISRSLVLVFTQNGDGTYAVDARWEKAL